MNQQLPESAAHWLALTIVIAACAATSTPMPSPPIMWRTTQSPVFPNEWPPTSSTTWTRYTFAYGNSPTTMLGDGMYVTRPLTRTAVRRDESEGNVIALSTVRESVGIQGVSPLDAASSAALNKGPQVQARLLQLTMLPDEAVAVELRDYYRTWINLNGTFVVQIRSEHRDFFDWLENDP